MTLIFGACAKEAANTADKSNSEKPAPKATNSAFVDIIRNQRMSNFRSVTIGNAFDSYKYLTNKEWKSASMKSGQITVDFTGWFEPDALNKKDVSNGVTGKGLDVMFVIEPNGSFYVFMVSKLEARTDGKIYQSQLDDTTAILTKIYSNQKI